jgi:serine/threonine protein kinase
MSGMSAQNTPAPPRITGFGYVRPLGSGGFADVFQYEQDMPRRVVAVKVLRNQVTGTRDRSDFESEADAMARLSSHPSIVSIYSAGVSADGRPYLAMEYCPDSMRERTRQNPAPLYAVLDAGVRLAGALETAHRANIMHRDIKPSNVLLTATGRPALTDFGISMLQGGFASESREQALSIPWSSPEVVTGKTTGTVASEVWALGATLYTFAAGFSPFEHPDRAQNTQSKMTARISQAKYMPIPGAQGYETFDAVLRKAMHLQPEQRYQSMEEFGQALRQLQRQFGYDATPLDLVEAAMVTPAAATDTPRGPVVTTVRTSNRAEQRAKLRAEQMRQDRDGVLIDQPKSSLRAGLIGAGLTVGVLAALTAVAFAFGWVG